MATTTNNRTQKLTLTADNQIARPFADAVASVGALTAKLQEQIKAAETGNATTRELGFTIAKLADAQKELSAQEGAVRAFEGLGDKLDLAKGKAEAAAATFEALKAKQDAATTSSARLDAAVTRAATASDKAAARYAQQAENVRLAGEALQRMGADLENLDGFTAQVVAEQERLSAAILGGREAFENYDATIRAHRANLQAARDFDQAYAQAVVEDQQRIDAAYKEAIEVDQQRTTARQAFIQTLLDGGAKEQAAAAARARFDSDFAAAAIEDAARVAAAHEREADAAAAASLRELQAERTLERQARDLARATREEQLAGAAEAQRIREETEARVQLNREIDESIKIRNADKAASRAAAPNLNKNILKPDEKDPNKPAAGQSNDSANQKSGFLGLRPYELQELSYRIKDVIDQLGSGASVSRVVAQQGAATASIFNREIGSLVAYIPLIGATAAAIGILGAAFYRLYQNESALRAFNSQLGLSVDGSNNSAHALLAQQRALQDLGNSFEASGEAIDIFYKAGIQPERLEAFGKAATGISRTFGTALPTAAKELVDAFTHGYQAIADFDNKYNVLTVAQRNYARGLEEGGKSAQAAAYVFDIYSSKLSHAGEVAQGPVIKAFHDLREAFNNTLDVFANSSAIQRAEKDFGDLAHIIDFLSGKLKNLSTTGTFTGVLNQAQIATQKAALEQQLQTAEQQRTALSSQTPSGRTGGSNSVSINQTIADLKKQINNLDKQSQTITEDLQATRDKAAAKDAQNLRDKTAAQAKIDSDLKRSAEIAEEADIRQNSAARILRAGLDAQRQALSAGASQDAANFLAEKARATEREKIGLETRRREEGLQREAAALGKAADNSLKDSLQARLAAVDETYSAITAKLEDLQRRGQNSVLGTPIPQYKAQVAANEALEKQAVTQTYYEEQLTKLAADRDAIYKQIDDDVKAGTLSATAGYAKAEDTATRLNPKIKQLAQDALAFARNLSGAHAGPTLDAFVNKAQRSLDTTEPGNKAGSGAGASPLAAAGNAEAQAAYERANDLIKERNELQAAYQELVTKGILTQDQADAKTKSAYDRTADSLRDAIKQAELLVKTLQAAGDTPGLDKLAAQLKGLEADQKFVTKGTEDMNKALAKDFVDLASKGLQSVTTEFGKVIAGTEKLGDGLRNAAGALVNLVASFLEGIAQIILKKEEEIAVQYVLKALGGGEDAGAVLHGGGRVGPTSNMTRAVSPSWFAGAPRYHDGTIVGLAPNEQAAILQHGEEVLSKSDPRNALNGGRRGQPDQQPQNFRHVLVMDPDIIPQAMNSAQGEKITLSHIKANVPTLRQLLNIGGRRVGGR